MVVLCDGKSVVVVVVAGGRRLKPSAEMEERISRISWKKGMVMGSMTDEAKSHLLRVFSVFEAHMISRVEQILYLIVPLI